MAEFSPELDITADDAEAFARGLFVVARADGGIHEREVAMIGELYASTTDTATSLGALERLPQIDAATLATQIHDPEKQQLFLKTAMLLAYADGAYGKEEAKVIAGFAEAMSVAEADLRSLETQVKEFMLSQLTHIQNTDAVAQVAKELKV
jgi:tellurite resistance protein